MCNRLLWTGAKCSQEQVVCDNLEWGKFISLHKMPQYHYGWQDADDSRHTT